MNDTRHENPKPSPLRMRRRLASRSPRSRGAVIVLALLGAFLMAGLIGYVFNTGRHAQVRQQTQSAADATVISGAGYVARAFNTVAMNNVEISRLIAVVQLLDAVPLAVEYTLLDVRATLERVEEQLRTGTGDPLGDITLRDIRDDLVEQENLLVDMDEFFNRRSYDVREMTFYDSEFGRGELWKAMESLDTINAATMESLTELSQTTAVEAGLKNMPEGGVKTVAAMAPFENSVFWRRYAFDDFRDPVTRGRLPDWIDDEVTNRGPYDTIFGWRTEAREYISIPNPNYDPDTSRRNAFGSSWSGGSGRGGPSRTIRVGSRLLGYRTYGTWRWLSNIVRSAINQREILYNSQFTTRVTRMGGNKLNYLWPGSAREWDFLDPQWITDFNQAEQIDRAGTPRIAYTQFIRMDYEQYFINGQAQGPETMTDWHILRPRGGHFEVPGATKTRNHVWEDESDITWETTRTETDEEGNEITVTDTHLFKYRRLFTWAGINVGPQIVIRNPNNFSSRNDLPAPTDFDHNLMTRPQDDGKPGIPGDPFTFLGIAKQPNTPQMWTRLYDKSAYDGHVAIAQAGVFNNHSWDLWTQMWHAQLEPVQGYKDWLTLMQGQIGSTTDTEGLSTGELQNTIQYMQSLETLAPFMLNH